MAAALLPISEISAYHANWMIRARITNKGAVRTFSKGGQSGKVFTIDLLDAKGGEIRANFFNQAAETFYPALHQGKCYTMAGGYVKTANRQFNACKHRYEITFDKEALIAEARDDEEIDVIKFSVVNLRSVGLRTMPCNVDLCGIITDYRAALSFTARNGQELTKRQVTIADDSATSLDVTIWGDKAKQEDNIFSGNPIVCLKGVLVKEWKDGRVGSLVQGGAFIIEPTVPEAEKVKEWWSQGGANQILTALSPEIVAGSGGHTSGGKVGTMADLIKASATVFGQSEIYSIVCRLAMVQTRRQGDIQPLHYLACQELKEGNGLPCNRRVDESHFCAACNKTGKVAPRYNLRCLFVDFGDSAWLTTFHEGAQRILGMDSTVAREMELSGDGGRAKVEAAIRGRYFDLPFQATLRAKPDTFNGEVRTNITCIDARPVQRREHARFLLREIQEML